MTTLKYPDFKGPAKRIEDMDLPRIGAEIGVGEDELHAFIDVETSGSGFDGQGRPKLLFEPHRFYAHLGTGKARDAAVKAGVAYKNWGEKAYPKDSYPVLAKAMAIDETAALKSSSWGLGQVMGENFADGGYASVQDMVNAMCEDEDLHLELMIGFIKAKGIDDDLRRLAALNRPTTPADCVPIVRVYNGAGFAKNKYDVKFADAHNRWRKIPDTPWTPEPAGPVITVPEPGEVSRDTVKQVQQLLRDKGYIEVGKVDGVAGKNTVSAITAFQIASGLPVTGKVGTEVLGQLVNAPMRPVSQERANASVGTLLDQNIAGAKEAVWLRRIGTGLTATMGIGAIFDGGPVDLDHVITSATKVHALYVMLGNAAPWLLGLGVGGAVLFFGHRMLAKQLDGFRKGTVR